METLKGAKQVKFNDTNALLNKDCYFCYSFNLHRFLKNEKEIFHINCGVNKTTKKTWFSYLKTEALNSALKEWTERKRIGKYYNVKREVIKNEDEA